MLSLEPFVHISVVCTPPTEVNVGAKQTIEEARLLIVELNDAFEVRILSVASLFLDLAILCVEVPYCWCHIVSFASQQDKCPIALSIDDEFKSILHSLNNLFASLSLLQLFNVEKRPSRCKVHFSVIAVVTCSPKARISIKSKGCH